MLITKKSALTGVERTLDIPVTLSQLDTWQRGMAIQEAMPNLTSNQREFLMTGIISEEVDNLFPQA